MPVLRESQTPAPLYLDDGQNAGITRDTTLQHLLFTQKGALMLQDFI